MQDLHLSELVGAAGGGSGIDEERNLSRACAVRTGTAELLPPRIGTVAAMLANEATILNRAHGTELEAHYAVWATNAYERVMHDCRIHNATSLLQLRTSACEARHNEGVTLGLLPAGTGCRNFGSM